MINPLIDVGIAMLAVMAVTWFYSRTDVRKEE
jgi:hypothetical protein